MRVRLLAALALLLAGLFGVPGAAVAAPGDISGTLPRSGGLALIVWGGGTAAAVQSGAAAGGCNLSAVWYLDSGAQEFVGHVFGAPGIVNARWDSRFGAGVAANTPLIVVCRAPQSATVAPAADTTDRDLSRRIADGINRERTGRGLPALGGSGSLTSAAERYAGMLLDAGRLDHALDGTEPWDRARAAGYPTGNVGEVIASRSYTGGIDVATQAANFVQMWMNSPPHRAIIMGESIPFRELGAGCASRVSGGYVSIYCAGLTGIP